MRRPISTTLVLFVALGGFGWAIAQSVLSDQGPPNHIPYRGHLELAGTPVNGAEDLTFFLVEDPADGIADAVWSDVYNAVDLQGGDFAVVLGAGTAPFPDGLFARGALYLGVSVDGVELSGRQQLLRTAYTVEAAHGPPPGAMMMFAGPTPPPGWLLADGATVNIADYPRLYAAIGTIYGGDGTTNFALPDLRQQYVTGADGPVPLGTTVGSNSLSHEHGEGTLGAHVGLSWTSAEGNRIQFEHDGNTFNPSNHHVPAGTFSNGDSAGGVYRTRVSGETDSVSLDTRPASVALHYIIKW